MITNLFSAFIALLSSVGRLKVSSSNSIICHRSEARLSSVVLGGGLPRHRAACTRCLPPSAPSPLPTSLSACLLCVQYWAQADTLQILGSPYTNILTNPPRMNNRLKMERRREEEEMLINSVKLMVDSVCNTSYLIALILHTTHL